MNTTEQVKEIHGVPVTFYIKNKTVGFRFTYNGKDYGRHTIFTETPKDELKTKIPVFEQMAAMILSNLIVEDDFNATGGIKT